MVRQFGAEKLPVAGAALITSFTASDDRGQLSKVFSKQLFAENGLVFEPFETTFIHSKKGVLRGLHFQQKEPQPKLICCLAGTVFAVLADLRAESKTLGQVLSFELDVSGGKALLVPHGCAFGTLALEDSLMLCSFGGKFAAEYAGGIRWDDPDLNIPWPLERLGSQPILAKKDEELPLFRSYLTTIGRMNK